MYYTVDVRHRMPKIIIEFQKFKRCIKTGHAMWHEYHATLVHKCPCTHKKSQWKFSCSSKSFTSDQVAINNYSGTVHHVIEIACHNWTRRYSLILFSVEQVLFNNYINNDGVIGRKDSIILDNIKKEKEVKKFIYQYCLVWSNNT